MLFRSFLVALLPCILIIVINQLILLNKDISRVHRGFIVNLSKVINVTGSAQGYKLHFNLTEVKIPVSRNKAKEIKNRLIS